MSLTIAQQRTARLQQISKNREEVARANSTPSPTPSPYPYPDLTLPWQTILMNLINEINVATLPQPLTTDVCVFGDPQSFGGSGANTVIPFGTNAPQIFGTGTRMFYYTRIDVSKVVAAGQPATSATTMGAALAAINSEYALNLQASDIIDGPITNGAGTLNISPASRLYTGSKALTFASSNPAPTPVPTPAPSPAVVPTANFVYTASDVNSQEIAFSDTSNDPSHVVTAWAWIFGDSGTSALQSPTHTYAAAGTYSVELSITDSTGTHSVTKSIVVAAGGDDETNASAPTPTPSP